MSKIEQELNALEKELRSLQYRIDSAKSTKIRQKLWGRYYRGISREQELVGQMK